MATTSNYQIRSKEKSGTMALRTREGIVLVKVCDTQLLVATREVWEKCPRIRPIPNLWAVCWRLMEKGKTDADVVRTFMKLFNKPEIEIRGRLEKMFMQLTAEGLFIDDSE